MKRIPSPSWLLGLPWLLLLVGAAQSDFCEHNKPPSNPDTAYIDHGDGTITDTRTGLMWKQCSEGLSGATCQTGSVQTFIWENALAHAEANAFANYSDWRLPNVKELSSLVEECRGSPAINTNRFPNTPNRVFWSSSPDTGGSDWTSDSSRGAWVVFFGNGEVGGAWRYRTEPNVRLVRGGQ